MKIRPLTVWVLVMAAIAVVYTVLGVAFLGQKRGQEALAFELTKLRLIVTGQQQKTADELKQQLAVAQARLDGVQAVFPAKLSSTEVLDWVLRLAREHQVKTLPVRVKPALKEKLGGQVCDVSRLEVKVGGSPPQLLAFINRLEEGTFKTLAVEKVSIVTTQQGETVATVSLAVYAHPPAQIATAPDAKPR